MGIFSRLGTLIKSNINDLITRAEDPEKMLNQVLIDMQSQLQDAKKAVAIAIADEKKLQKQLNQELDKAKDWERKAMVAVRSGSDDLAKQALGRKQEHENIASQFETQWVSQKQAVVKLKDALRLLNQKIEEAKRKKNILIARKKRAEAQQQIAATMQGIGDASAFDTFERMADRINMLEAQAEAGAELAGELSGDTLEAQFMQLEAGGAGEDDALHELKAKMGLLEAGDDTKQLPEGDASEDSDSSTGSHLTDEDLKELEDLDLSELEKQIQDEVAADVKTIKEEAKKDASEKEASAKADA